MSKLNWQEPTAYATSVAAIAVGIYLGHPCEAAWLSRAGSVVVVIGVLLATSRKIELLRKKANALITNHQYTEFQNLVAEFQNQDGTPISESQAAQLKEKIYSEAYSETEELIQERARIFKMHEVIIVIAGTLLNGFGEWLMKLAQ
jgi:hypothetical protein